MALIYGMVKYKDFFNIDTKKDTTSFVQKFYWVDDPNYTVVDRLPGIKAPSSTVHFWRKYLKLAQNTAVESFDDCGYFSLNELIAELSGFYMFWEDAQFVYISIY